MDRLKRTLALLFTVIALTALLAAPALAEGYGTQKAVYHVNTTDLAVISGGLRNMQNHINAVGADKVKIVVVVHAGGYVMFFKGKTTDEIVAKLKKLKAQGVQFRLCANTARKQKMVFGQNTVVVTEKDLVPAGVAELTKLQQQGYAYIKP